MAEIAREMGTAYSVPRHPSPPRKHSIAAVPRGQSGLSSFFAPLRIARKKEAVHG